MHIHDTYTWIWALAWLIFWGQTVNIVMSSASLSLILGKHFTPVLNGVGQNCN